MKKFFLWFLIVALSLFLLSLVFVYFYEEKIKQHIISVINEDLNAKIEVQRIDLTIWKKFPNTSLDFKNVIIKSSNLSETNLLEASNLFISFNFLDMINNDIKIKKIFLENAILNIDIDKKGVGNFNILKEKERTEEPSEETIFEISKIQIKNTMVNYVNQFKSQSITFLIHKTSGAFNYKTNDIHININSENTINHITLNGSTVLREKKFNIDTELGLNDDKISIKHGKISLSRFELNLLGFVENKEDKTILDLSIVSPPCDLLTLASLLPHEVKNDIEKYKTSGFVKFDAKIKGLVSNTESPNIFVNLKGSNITMFEPSTEISLNNVEFDGVFSNGNKRKSSSSYLALNHVRGKLDQQPFEMEFKIFDFDHPFIEAKMKTTQMFKDLVAFTKMKDIEASGGTVSIDLSLKTHLKDLQTKKLNKKLNFRGELKLDSLSFKHAALAQKVDFLACDINLDQNMLSSDNLFLKIGPSEISTKFSLSNLLPFMLEKNQSLKVDVNLVANSINTNEMFSKKSSDANGNQSSNNESKDVKLVLINLDTKIDDVVHERYRLREFKSKISVLNKKISISDLSFKTLGGAVQIPSLILNQESNTIDRYDLTFKTEKIKIDSLMILFDDFEQKFITNKNLRGDFTSEGQCSFTTNKKGDFNPKSLNAQIDFSILNGQLIKFEPMKKLSKFIKHQDLEDIRFHELKNSIHIEDELISIPEMTIKSNLNTITVLGTQHFDGSMNYKLALDLKNYKVPPGESHNFKPDSEGRTQLFLNMSKTANGDLKIAYDTKATKEKINESLKREKEEFVNIFKKKKEEKKVQKLEISEEELMLDD